MKILKVNKTGHPIAVVNDHKTVIRDVQSALDFMATVRYEVDCDRIVIPKIMLHEDFFDLKTRLAGDILQKFINYRVKLAVVGDFTKYTSQSLNDFIYECNNGNHFFFLPAEQEAIDKLSAC